VIGSDLKLSAEEIEMGLIKPDSSLAQLHIAILKVFYSYYIYLLVAALFIELVVIPNSLFKMKTLLKYM
jgi:hypothetical protein